VMTVSVCLSVRVSASVSPQLHVRALPNFLRMLPVAVAGFSSNGVLICYVLYV